MKMHPHPNPLPSRERENWMESISILGTPMSRNSVNRRDDIGQNGGNRAGGGPNR